MFSVFPHFDDRIGVGQRSGYNQSDAIIFLDKRTVVCGCSRRKIPPLIVYLMGKAGTLSIPTIVTTTYIEKVVFRIGRGWSSILSRTLISSTATAWVTRDPEIDPIGPPPNASGAVLVGEESVAFANSLQIRPGQVFNLSDLGLLVVYDARFKDSKIYGYIGGYERPNPTSTVLNHSRTAESCFNCPRCEAPAIAGQLICFSCSTIYLFEGRDRFYSPMWTRGRLQGR